MVRVPRLLIKRSRIKSQQEQFLISVSIPLIQVTNTTKLIYNEQAAPSVPHMKTIPLTTQIRQYDKLFIMIYTYAYATQ